MPWMTVASTTVGVKACWHPVVTKRSEEKTKITSEAVREWFKVVVLFFWAGIPSQGGLQGILKSCQL
jgi:hypothetical protein